MVKTVKSIELYCQKCDKIMNLKRNADGSYDFSDLCFHEMPSIHNVHYLVENDEK